MILLKNLILLLFFLGGTLACATRNYDVKYYKDGTFQNHYGHSSKSFFQYLWMRLRTSQQTWPEFLELPEGEAQPLAQSEDLIVHSINHSTFLIQKSNINIITDPVFSERTSPVSWAGPKRVMPPGISIDNLPKIDFILISHDHYDHLDIESIRKIAQRDQSKILVGLGVGRVFEDEDFQEMEWEEVAVFDKVRFVFTTAQHFSGRTLFDRNTTLWGSFVIQFPDMQIYFGGDSGYGPHYQDIFKKYGAMQLSLLPIGAYAPRSFMRYHHMDPAEAFQAFDDLKSETALGMHWGTFQLTNEGREEPQILLEELQKQRPESQFVAPVNGDSFKWASGKLEKLSKYK